MMAMTHEKRRYSFGETISARREFFARIEKARKREINDCDYCQRPKPAGQTAALIMPDGGSDDTSERHRKHEFPGEVHDLIDARARQRSADPDVNEKQRAQFQEKPNIGWNEVEDSDRRMPAAEKQSHGESADREHPEIFRHEKGGVFEAGIFGHVAGDDFRFAFRDIEGSAVGFDQTGDKKQNEGGRAPGRE